MFLQNQPTRPRGNIVNLLIIKISFQNPKNSASIQIVLMSLLVDLIVIVRLCLILSHGNARVEFGFSINENLLQVNMKECSAVSQRLTYEGIYRCGVVVELKVTKATQMC